MGNIEAPTLDTNIKDQDILLCLRTLYGTVAGTCALDRDFGIDSTFISKPIDVIENLYANEVILKTEKYEPRVEVTEVTFERNENILIPTIHFQRTSEEEEDET